MPQRKAVNVCMNFTTVHPIVAEIFQSRPTWWTAPGATSPAWLKAKYWNGKCWKTWLFITAQIKSRHRTTQQPCWRPYGDLEENRVFWSCTEVKPFLDNINATMRDIMGYAIPNKCAAMHQRNIEGALQDPTWQPDKNLLAAAKHLEQEDVKQILREQRFVIAQEIHSVEKLTYLWELKKHTTNPGQLKDFYCEAAGWLLLWRTGRAFTIKKLQGFYCKGAAVLLL